MPTRRASCPSASLLLTCCDDDAHLATTRVESHALRHTCQLAGRHPDHSMPPDVKLTPIDRGAGPSFVVDEFIFEFTHTVIMDWMLPGVLRVAAGCGVLQPFEAAATGEQRQHVHSVLLPPGIFGPRVACPALAVD